MTTLRWIGSEGGFVGAVGAAADQVEAQNEVVSPAAVLVRNDHGDKGVHGGSHDDPPERLKVLRMRAT
jgi:hypothetical protein